MKEYRICVTISGYASVQAESEEEAIRAAMNLGKNDFDWEPFNREVIEDAEIVEVVLAK